MTLSFSLVVMTLACYLAASSRPSPQTESEERARWEEKKECAYPRDLRLGDYMAAPYDQSWLQGMGRYTVHYMAACRDLCDRSKACKGVTLVMPTPEQLRLNEYLLSNCLAYKECTPISADYDTPWRGIAYMYVKPVVISTKAKAIGEKLNVWTSKSKCEHMVGTQLAFHSGDLLVMKSVDDALKICQQKCQEDAECDTAELSYTGAPSDAVCNKYTDQSKCNLSVADDSYTFEISNVVGRWMDNRACIDKVDKLFWEGDPKAASFKGASGATGRDEESLKASCATLCRKRVSCHFAVFHYSDSHAKCSGHTWGCTIGISESTSLYFSSNVWRSGATCGDQGVLVHTTRKEYKKNRGVNKLTQAVCQKDCDSHPRCVFAMLNPDKGKANKDDGFCTLYDSTCHFTVVEEESRNTLYMARGDEFSCNGRYPQCDASCSDVEYVHFWPRFTSTLDASYREDANLQNWAQECTIAAGTKQTCTAGMGACGSGGESDGSGESNLGTDDDLLAILANLQNEDGVDLFSLYFPEYIYEPCPKCDQVYYECSDDGLSTVKQCKNDLERPDCADLHFQCAHKDLCHKSYITQLLNSMIGDGTLEADSLIVDSDGGVTSGVFGTEADTLIVDVDVTDSGVIETSVTSNFKTEQCANHEASLLNQDCVPANWQPWEACSAECGGGKQTRSREVRTPKKGEGEDCKLSQERPCNEHVCGEASSSSTPASGTEDDKGECTSIESASSLGGLEDVPDAGFVSLADIRAWCRLDKCKCNACAAEWSASQKQCKVGRLGDDRLRYCGSYKESYDLCAAIKGCTPKATKTGRLKCKGQVNL